jgi:hypothetical protein
VREGIAQAKQARPSPLVSSIQRRLAFELRLIALAEQSSTARVCETGSGSVTTALKVHPAAEEALHSNPTRANTNRRPKRLEF